MQIFGNVYPLQGLSFHLIEHATCSSFLPTIEDLLTYKLFRHEYTDLLLRGKIS